MFYLDQNQSKGGTQNLPEFCIDISIIYKSLVTISGQRTLLGHRGGEGTYPGPSFSS